MYTETTRVQPVSETPFALCDSLQQMLLQSWNGKVRVFPAVPEAWKNLAIDGMLAAGGFKIGAVRKDGQTKFVTVKSLAGEPCLISADLETPVRVVGIMEESVKALGNGIFQIDLKAGEEVTLLAKGFDGEAIIAPVPAAEKNLNFFGLKSNTK